MKLEAVGKRYGARQPWVVRDATTEVPAGQLIRVDGQNGAGKSTLLRVVAGVTMPSRGRVAGRPRTGYVPERFPGGLPFSCRDYLRHMARLHGGGSVDEWLERLGATAFAAAPMRTLSKGMTQKVAVAQALLFRPDLLVLDEAWTGLDQAARGALDVAVRERVTEGGTVLFVDHDPARLSGSAGQRWTLDGTASLTITTRPAPPGPARLMERGDPRARGRHPDPVHAHRRARCRAGLRRGGQGPGPRPARDAARRAGRRGGAGGGRCCFRVADGPARLFPGGGGGRGGRGGLPAGGLGDGRAV
ncbi:MAG: ATP-binding cassette domain-containing protein [Streptosporangiaceae bacterium]|jgi:ABC-type Mn2+/Zn2+ transport system ATPase subunit